MGNIIGIDIGGSTTKIVGYNSGLIFSPLLVKANDPIASVYGAFGKFLSVNNLQLAEVDRVMVTGVGSSYITSRLHNIPTGKVSEFQSIGLGGRLLSGLSNAIIVSMGTGTAYIKSDDKGVRHLGGSGVGGGTLLGLSHTMLNVSNFDDLIETAQGGSLAHVDLTIGDISRDVLAGLPPETTASNFGKLSDLATKADLAVGIINLVFQTIGLLAVFAARVDHTRDIILTGNLANVPQAPEMFAQLSSLFNVNFIIPPNAEFATAAGAAVSFLEGVDYQEF